MKDPFYFQDPTKLSNVDFLEPKKISAELSLALLEGDFEGEEQLEELIPSVDELETLVERASSGNPKCLFRLGEYSERGAAFLIAQKTKRVRRVFPVSEYTFNFYKEAADLGHREAQFRTGNLLYAGDGVEQNSEGAAHYWGLAAELGHATAEANLGQQFMAQGEPVKALKCFEKAASAGDATGLYNLSVAFEEGAGCSQDSIKSLELLHQAAEQGFTQAQLKLAHLYAAGDGVGIDDAKALEYFRACAEKGVVDAQYAVGALLYKSKDIVEANRWFLCAAQNGHVNAQLNVAVGYANGEGLEPDLMHAYYWAIIASQHDKQAAELAGQIRASLTDEQAQAVESNLRQQGGE